MPRPETFVNRFRYAILAVLIVVTLGYGWFLYRQYAPAPPPAPPPSIPVAVMADGSVEIDGVQYGTVEALTPKITAIQSQHPDVGFTINAPRGQDFNGIAKAVVLMRKSGANTVWVINDPQKKP